MAFEISRRFTLQAAHRLPRVPEGHKCGRMHGHTWEITISVRGDVDPEAGWFCDFAVIDESYDRCVHRALDHGCMNDVIANPTTENLCAWIADRLGPTLPGLCRVDAKENDRSCVSMQVEPERAATSTASSNTGGG